MGHVQMLPNGTIQIAMASACLTNIHTVLMNATKNALFTNIYKHIWQSRNLNYKLQKYAEYYSFLSLNRNKYSSI